MYQEIRIYVHGSLYRAVRMACAGPASPETVSVLLLGVQYLPSREVLVLQIFIVTTYSELHLHSDAALTIESSPWLTYGLAR
jgi:hypothetical protein